MSDRIALQRGTILVHPNGRYNYTINEILSDAGGFGLVYKATESFDDGMGAFQTEVCIKEFFPDLGRNILMRNGEALVISGGYKEEFQYYMELFKKEAYILNTLKSADANLNIPEVRAQFELNQTRYIVMEYIEGINLSQLMERRDTCFSIKEALEFLKPVYDTLKYLHQIGHIHADLNPNNIVLGKNGKTYLLDFGNVADLDKNGRTRSLPKTQRLPKSNTEWRIQQENAIVSSPMPAGVQETYAPREFFYEKQFGRWTDVYFLAAILYVMLIGRKGEDCLRKGKLDINKLKAPKTVNCSIPKGIDKAIMKALSPDHENRYQTIEEFWDALQEKQDFCRKESVIPALTIIIGLIVVGSICNYHASNSSNSKESTKTDITQEQYDDTENYKASRNKVDDAEKKYVDGIIEKADTFVKNGDYENAISVVSDAVYNLPHRYSKSSSGDVTETTYQGLSDEGKKLLEYLSTKTEEWIEAEYQAMEYKSVFKIYQDAVDNEDIEVSDKMNDTYNASVTEYLKDVDSRAESAFGESKDYVAAMQVYREELTDTEELNIDEIRSHLEDNKESYRAYIPINLSTLECTQICDFICFGLTSDDYYDHSDDYRKDVNGQSYDGAIFRPSGGSILEEGISSEEASEKAYVMYNLNYQYSALTGVIYRPYGSLKSKNEWKKPTVVRIYGDDQLLYEAPNITKETYDTYDISIDVSGVRNLKIVMSGYIDGHPKVCMADLQLQK